jgi:rubrerythrin
MSVKWDGAKLLKTIAENEAGATKFYRAIASEARFGEKFFENLAKDEERHEKIYNALLDKHSTSIDVEIDENEAEYMDLLIENNLVFDDKLIEKAKKLFTKDQIFDLAEKAERDTVMYVIELQKLFPNLAKD